MAFLAADTGSADRAGPQKVCRVCVPSCIYAQVAIVTMNHLQHDGCDDEINSINSARNFVGPVINFFTFNNGYHLVHHLKPKLHWSLLPAEHERLVAGKAHEALNQRCMATYMFCAYIYPETRRLHRQARDAATGAARSGLVARVRARRRAVAGLCVQRVEPGGLWRSESGQGAVPGVLAGV